MGGGSGRYLLPWRVGAIVTAALLVTVGCSPGAPSTPPSPPSGAASGPAPTAAIATAPTSATPVVAAKPAASPAGQVTPTAVAGPLFTDLVARSKSASYKVTYRVSSTSTGQTLTGEQTWYVKPPRMRMDITIAGLGPAGASSLFVLEDGSYLCTSGNTMCMRFPHEASQQQNPAAAVQSQLQLHSDQVKATRQASRVIAGREAECYAVTTDMASGLFAEAVTCYDAQGVPLFLDSKGADMQVTLEATSYSTSVADADFELPAEPVDFPTSPGQPPIPKPPGG